MEQFEDDPVEFIRFNLALPGAAAAVLQALVGCGYEAEATGIVGKWIGVGFAAYQGHEGWEWVDGEGQRDVPPHGG